VGLSLSFWRRKGKINFVLKTPKTYHLFCGGPVLEALTKYNLVYFKKLHFYLGFEKMNMSSCSGFFLNC